MKFKRNWDSSCPHVWDTWEANGKTWVIQDLPPEDDEEALQILVEHLVPDEPLCTQSEILKDDESMEGMSKVWRGSLGKRMSVACYTDVDGKKTLVALNCCLVAVKGDDEHPEIIGEAWKNVYGVIAWAEEQEDVFEYLKVDKVLMGLGLVVKRDFRGAKLGARLLNSREPLCRSLGIEGTATVFTGTASQKLAARAGFTTVVEATWADLADAGLNYPRNERIIKYMVKKYE